jgi:hypothetical protein
MPAIGSAADRSPNPERQCVRGIRGNKRNSREQQRREGHKTSAAGDCIHRSGKCSSKKQ